MNATLKRRAAGRPTGHHQDTVRWALWVARVAVKLRAFLPPRRVIGALALVCGTSKQRIRQLLVIADCARGVKCDVCRERE